MPSLRSYLAGAALVALATAVGPVSAASDDPDCINPPHPLLNKCAGHTKYRPKLSILMTDVAEKLDFVQALGKPAADTEVVDVDNLSGAFVDRLEPALREPNTGKVRFVERGGVLNSTQHAFRALGIISPDVRDDIQVCFEAGPSKEARRLVAVFNIQPNGTVSNTTARHTKFGVCNEFAVAARDEIKKKLAENTPAPSMQ